MLELTKPRIGDMRTLLGVEHQGTEPGSSVKSRGEPLFQVAIPEAVLKRTFLCRIGDMGISVCVDLQRREGPAHGSIHYADLPVAGLRRRDCCESGQQDPDGVPDD